MPTYRMSFRSDWYPIDNAKSLAGEEYQKRISGPLYDAGATRVESMDQHSEDGYSWGTQVQGHVGKIQRWYYSIEYDMSESDYQMYILKEKAWEAEKKGKEIIDSLITAAPWLIGIIIIVIVIIIGLLIYKGGL